MTILKYVPLVTIIIPVYNGANFLKDCIESALAQTYKNIEIIVVNDGSIDDGATEKIAKLYKNKIRYLVKENGGVSSALNYGLKVAKGEWISWLSHDDIYTADKIEKQIDTLQNYVTGNSNLDKTIIYSNSVFVNDIGKVINQNNTRKEMQTFELSRADLFKEIYIKNGISGCTVLFPKSCVDLIGYFDEELRYMQDIDYWCRMVFNGFKFVKLSDVLVKTRRHRGQLSVKGRSIYLHDRIIVGKRVINHIAQNFIEYKNIIKPYLNFCALRGDKNQTKLIIELLKKENSYSIMDFFKYKFFSILSSPREFLRKIRNRFL